MPRVTIPVLAAFLLLSSCSSELASAQGDSIGATPSQSLPESTPAHPAVNVETRTPTSTASIVPDPPPATTVRSLPATVTAELLSCRYGPGPEYLFLYALRVGANIRLVGRTDAENWHWAWVEGRNRCWVNTSYLSITGDWRELPVVYPGIARLPVSPYYPPTSIVSVVRNGNSVTVEWANIRMRAGDEEDPFMQHYILETWHCQNRKLIFEPLATNDVILTFSDEPGCRQSSHARVFVQEKHGFSGPTDVPWPAFQ